jgi:hypothetical protein
MKTNKSLGSNAVLSLSHAAGVVDRKTFRDKVLYILALIGWTWMLWYLYTHQVMIP